MKVTIRLGSGPAKSKGHSSDKLRVSKIIAEITGKRKEEIDALVFSKQQEEELLKILSK